MLAPGKRTRETLSRLQPLAQLSAESSSLLVHAEGLPPAKQLLQAIAVMNALKQLVSKVETSGKSTTDFARLAHICAHVQRGCPSAWSL